MRESLLKPANRIATPGFEWQSLSGIKMKLCQLTSCKFYDALKLAVNQNTILRQKSILALYVQGTRLKKSNEIFMSQMTFELTNYKIS